MVFRALIASYGQQNNCRCVTFFHTLSIYKPYKLVFRSFNTEIFNFLFHIQKWWHFFTSSQIGTLILFYFGYFRNNFERKKTQYTTWEYEKKGAEGKTMSISGTNFCEMHMNLEQIIESRHCSNNNKNDNYKKCAFIWWLKGKHQVSFCVVWFVVTGRKSKYEPPATFTNRTEKRSKRKKKNRIALSLQNSIGWHKKQAEHLVTPASAASAA